MQLFKSIKIVLLISFSFLSTDVFSQIAKIKVLKVRWEVSITSVDSIFWIGKENPVSITVKGGGNYAIDLKGGTLSKKAGNYFVNATEEGAVTISVFELLPADKKRVLFTKLIPVQRIPFAQIFVCGVKADSVIDKDQIINDNVITAYHPFYKTNLPVLGFDMVFVADSTTEILTSPNNHFTIDMRKRVYGIKSGTRVYFENIYYLLPNGDTEKIESIGIYVSESNKYKVGYRVRGL